MRVEQRKGWYFTPAGVLRECIVLVTAFAPGPMVIDVETGEPVSVPVEDVLTEVPGVVE